MTKQRMRHPVFALRVALCATLVFAAGPIFGGDYSRHDRQKDCERSLRQADLEQMEQMPFLWAVVAPPIRPVKGADGLIHLAYELAVTSLVTAPARIEAVEVVDPTRDNLVVEVVSGDEVASSLLLSSDEFSATLGPDQSGVMLFDLTFEEREDVPTVLAHRVTVSVELESSRAFSQLGGCTGVSRRPAIVLSPPLTGDGWFNANGCCESLHNRAVVLLFNGALQMPQRFANDLMQVDAEHRQYVGDPADATNWVGYLAEVVAAAPGEVVTAVDGFPDQVPLTDPDLTLTPYNGNHVIIDMGRGRFALYAHLAPQSIMVQPGERVRRGQLLGLLGNSGNSDAPHLHFQVTDGGSGLNGVPYVFDRWVFQGRGVLDLGEDIVDIDPTGSGKRQTKTLPLHRDIMGFADRP